MRIEKKYYRNRVVHRTLLPNADDANNNELSCGFLYKGKREGIKKDILFPHYGGLYVISGTGIYVDAKSGKEYPITPGCVVQRMPGVTHHHIYTNKSSDWLEFYFCAGEKIFQMLSSMHLISTEPVFYIGESMEIFQRLENYLLLFEQAEDRDTPMLVLEFQKLLTFLNERRDCPKKNSAFDDATELLRKNYKLGVSIPALIAGSGIGYESFRKRFRSVYNCSPEQYRIYQRINAAKSMLLDKSLPIKTIAVELGYCDEYAFCKQFKQYVGVSPRQFALDRFGAYTKQESDN
jgi:AraC-like DNA-binding protein